LLFRGKVLQWSWETEEEPHEIEQQAHDAEYRGPVSLGVSFLEIGWHGILIAGRMLKRLSLAKQSGFGAEKTWILSRISV
jgi:hypothetical protein